MAILQRGKDGRLQRFSVFPSIYKIAVLLILLLPMTASGHDHDPHGCQDCSESDCAIEIIKLTEKIEICCPCETGESGYLKSNVRILRAWLCELDCPDGVYSECRFAGEFEAQKHWIDLDTGEEMQHTGHTVAVFQLEKLKLNQWYRVKFECEDKEGNVSDFGGHIDFVVRVCPECYLDKICCWEGGVSVPCNDGEEACFP